MSQRTRTAPFSEAFLFGVDLMVVDRDTLDARPMVPDLVRTAVGAVPATTARGTLSWDLCTAAHLLHIRANRPVRKHGVMHRRLVTEIKRVNDLLARHNAMLLPGGAHPWLHPASGTTASGAAGMPPEEILGKVFQVTGHGWRNAPGTVLAVPFRSDGEFARLHAAARLLVPVLPALAAASPYLEGQRTGFLDARLEALLHVAEDHPELGGSTVPEAVYEQEAYDREVLGPIAQAMARAGAANALDPELANRRSVAPHFDNGTLDLRTADPQECPKADIAVAEFTTAVLKALANGRWASSYLQRAWPESDLLAIYLQVIKDGERAVIANRDLLFMFGLLKQDHLPAGKLWQHLFVELYSELSAPTRGHIAMVLEHGTLATRLLKHTGRAPGAGKLRTVYRELATCLREDRPLH